MQFLKRWKKDAPEFHLQADMWIMTHYGKSEFCLGKRTTLLRF